MIEQLEIPAFLKRNKDNTLKQKSKSKTPVLVHKGNGAQVTVDIYAGLSDSAKTWVQDQVKLGRFREAWLGDASTVAFVEKQVASAVADNKMSDDVKDTLRARRPARPSRDGLIGIAAIATELKIVPRVARAALRSMKKVKPQHGWAWSTDEAAKIKGEIQQCLASPSSTKSAKPSKSKKSSSKPAPKQSSQAQAAPRQRSAPTPTSRRSNAASPASQKTGAGRRK